MTQVANGLAVLVLAFSLNATAAMADEKLVNEKIHNQQFVGNTVLGKNEETLWKVYYKNSEERIIETASGFIDEGKRWFNSSGELCTEWDLLYRGDTVCYKLWIEGDIIRWTGRYGIERKAKLVNGNHKGWNEADWKY